MLYLVFYYITVILYFFNDKTHKISCIIFIFILLFVLYNILYLSIDNIVSYYNIIFLS